MDQWQCSYAVDNDPSWKTLLKTPASEGLPQIN